VLRSEKDALSQRVTELLERISVQSETATQALSSALSSTIRLCVVAPTVNVHVADNRLKFRAK